MHNTSLERLESHLNQKCSFCIDFTYNLHNICKYNIIMCFLLIFTKYSESVKKSKQFTPDDTFPHIFQSYIMQSFMSTYLGRHKWLHDVLVYD